ncbi:hypothetical protein [Laribacter hongkongensis]|uniref:hypothetical protein n=1 Tax=Laribacter hongkongensis TaxID=168471 RepID=UPI001EFD54D4|nr:hypothetical protein [Laribacter hongkongensis]MCG9076220.1 hypothetical protein [Laribacter hongkongensis]
MGAMEFDIKTIRKMNLQALVRELGSAAELARRTDTPPAYLSQILGNAGKKNVGDNLARRAEAACGKPRNWMDMLHPENQPDDADGSVAGLLASSQQDRLATYFTPGVLPLVEEIRDLDLAGTLPPELIYAVRVMLKAYTAKRPVSGLRPNEKLRALQASSSAQQDLEIMMAAGDMPWERHLAGLPATPEDTQGTSDNPSPDNTENPAGN